MSQSERKTAELDISYLVIDVRWKLMSRSELETAKFDISYPVIDVGWKLMSRSELETAEFDISCPVIKVGKYQMHFEVSNGDQTCIVRYFHSCHRNC